MQAVVKLMVRHMVVFGSDSGIFERTVANLLPSSVVYAVGNSLKAACKAFTPGSLSFALVCSSQILVGGHILMLL